MRTSEVMMSITSVMRRRRSCRYTAMKNRAPRGARSVLGAGAEDLLEHVEVLQALPRAEHHRVERTPRPVDRHSRLGLDDVLEPDELRAATSDDDALLHDVRRELRWCLVERDFHCIDDRGGGFLDRFADLHRGDDDRLRESAHEVAAAYFGVDLFLERPRARELHLHFFCGAFAERKRVLALHEVDDRFVELVTADAARLADDDAAERDHRDLGRAAADVDDHVPGGFVHRQARADRRRHRFLDHEHRLPRAGELGRFLHRATIDGSSSTMPRPRTYTRVFAVPRSTAMSRPTTDWYQGSGTMRDLRGRLGFRTG